MESKFKFKIGDLVYLKVGVQECLDCLKFGRTKFPTCHIVCERLCQECPGGIQLHYKLEDGPLLMEHCLVGTSDQSVLDLFRELAVVHDKLRDEQSRKDAS